MPYPKSDGRVSVDGADYYIKQALAAQLITLCVNAAERCFEVLQQESVTKQLSIKGLPGQRMSLDDYIALMQERARSEERQRMMNLRRRHPRLDNLCACLRELIRRGDCCPLFSLLVYFSPSLVDPFLIFLAYVLMLTHLLFT